MYPAKPCRLPKPSGRNIETRWKVGVMPRSEGGLGLEAEDWMADITFSWAGGEVEKLERRVERVLERDWV